MHNQTRAAIGAAFISVIGNLFLATIKALAGVLGNSYALIADAIESTVDVFSSIIVLFGIRYAHKPADKNHPYGHGRIEPLVTFIVVIFLGVSAFVIAYKSIININTPHELPASWTLFVLTGIVLWKEGSYQVISGKARKLKSSTLKAEAWHHRSDAITSVAAFIGISIALLLGDGYEAADDWAALFASGFILYNCYHIFRPAFGEMMDEHLHHSLIVRIREIATQVDGIEGTEKCFVRKSGTYYHVDLHACVDGTLSVSEGHRIAHRLQDTLNEELPELGQILIHIEPIL